MCELFAPWAFPNPTLAHFFATFIDAPLFLLIAGIVTISALRERRYWSIVIFGASLLLAYVSIDVLKSLFMIPRPDGALVDTVSTRFPSGHALMASALATAAFLLHREHLSPRAQLVAAVCAATLALLVGLVRILLVVHCPVDIVVGSILGFAIVWLTFWISRHYREQ